MPRLRGCRAHPGTTSGRLSAAQGQSGVGSISIDVHFDDRKIRRLIKNAEALDGEHSYPINDLLTPEFMAGHSQYGSFEELVRESRLLPPDEPINKEVFEGISKADWDGWISRATDFPNWKAMVETAGVEHFKRKLFEGV